MRRYPRCLRQSCPSFDLRAQAIPGNEVFPEPDYWVDHETFIREYKAMLADITKGAEQGNEVDASHLVSRGPILERIIATGTLANGNTQSEARD